MSNIYFSVSAFFCILLIVILFFSKEKINNNETKIYSLMILGSMFDIVIGIILVLIGYFFYNDIGKILIIILNKIDFIYYIWWPSLFLLYIINLCYDNNTLLKCQKYITFFNCICILIQLFLPIEIINNDNSM